MATAIYLAVALIISIVTSLVIANQNKVKLSNEAQQLNENNLPIASETATIPVVFGTALITNSNLIAYGNFKSWTKNFGSRKKPKPATLYFLDWINAISLGSVDSVNEIIFGDKIAWTGNITENTSVYIDKWHLFGGAVNASGGVQGDMFVQFGASSQVPPASMNAVLGVKNFNLNYRGVTTLYFKDFYVGTQPTVPALKVKVSRIMNRIDGRPQWYPEKCKIANIDMNPIHAIYEILTSKHPKFGLGYSESMIDLDNFKECADVLYDEGLGLSFTIQDQQSTTDVLKLIYDHINAIPSIDFETGKFKIKLVRANYDYDTVRTLTEADIIEVTQFVQSDADGVYTEIQYQYEDLDRYKTGTIVLNNNAVISNLGFNNTKKIKGDLCKRYDLALKLASRELQIATSSLSTMKVQCNSNCFDMEIGDVVKINLALDNYPQVAYRVMSAEFNDTFTTVTFTLTEDIFGQPPLLSKKSVFDIEPRSEVATVTGGYIYDLNSYDIEMSFNSIMANAIPTNRSILGFIVETSARMIPVKLLVGDEIYEEVFTPSKVLSLTKPLSKTDTKLQLSGSVTVNQVLSIDQERMLVVAVDENGYTVARGIQDSVPATHNLGANVLIITNDNVYEEGAIVSSSFEAYLFNAQADYTSNLQMFAISHIPQARWAKPNPPQNVKINNAYDNVSLSGSTCTITWSIRDKDVSSWYENGTGSTNSNVKYYVEYDGKTIELLSFSQTLEINKTTGLVFKIYAKQGEQVSQVVEIKST